MHEWEAYEMMESGREVKIIFDGAATELLPHCPLQITSIMTCSNNEHRESPTISIAPFCG
jgi:hypothetical protein